MMRILLSSAICAAATFAVADPNPLRDAYFGETHLHAAFSLDAYIGGTRLMPADSLAYARGEPVTLPDGTTAQLRRPLDFAAVTDHTEYLGEMYSTIFEDAPGHGSEDLVALRGLKSLKDRQDWFIKYVVSSNRSATPRHPPFFAGPETSKSA